jgi:hypothetical protein
MTDSPSETLRVQAERVGVKEILSKPIDADAIHSIVERLAKDTSPLAGPHVAYRLTIPTALEQQRKRLAFQMARAAGERGAIGATAKEAERLWQLHATSEDQFALPPLGALSLLSHGFVWPEMRPAIGMARALRSQLPDMLEQHAEIVEALRAVEDAAERAGRLDIAALAVEGQQLAAIEAEVLYPAAIVTGQVLGSELDGTGLA